MINSVKYINNLEELRLFLKQKTPFLLVSSETSTVIPWNEELGLKLNLNKMPKSMKYAEGFVTITGPVTWEEIKEYLSSFNVEMPCSPTEKSACVLAGIATSATGERSFSYGPLKNWVHEITYMNYLGEIKKLNREPNPEISSNYKNDYNKFSEFKNAPFPKLTNGVDLMIGTEGQLGIILEAKLKTVERYQVECLMMKLPSWVVNYSAHLKIFSLLQGNRSKVLSAEFFDQAALNFSPIEKNIDRGFDYLALEIKKDFFDEIVEKLTNEFSAEAFFVMEISEYMRLRLAIPRSINEHNQRFSMRKLGTDIQVPGEHLKDLLDLFIKLTKEGLPFCLFGHFGDAHLHFNLVSSKDDFPRAKQIMDQIYEEMTHWKFPLSPFAEHGIGLIKQPFVRKYWSEVQFKEFKKLKDKYDPERLFFPRGFMNL